jgi:hypothetical protein
MATAAFKTVDGSKMLVLSQDNRELISVAVPHNLTLGKIGISLDFNFAPGKIGAEIEGEDGLKATFASGDLSIIGAWIQSEFVFRHAIKQAIDADSWKSRIAYIVQYIAIAERTVAAVFALQGVPNEDSDYVSLMDSKIDLIDKACNELISLAVYAEHIEIHE